MANWLKSVSPVRITVLLCAAGNLCSFGQAQTNVCRVESRLFCQPAIQLRQTASASSSGVSASQPGHAGAAWKGLMPQAETHVDLSKSESASLSEPGTASSPKLPVEAELSSSLEGHELHGSFVRSDRFYLTRDEPPQFDNPVDKFVDGVFRPEVFHIGKLPATCSIWTAIKRKNPLCLLNPLFFQVSW